MKRAHDVLVFADWPVRDQVCWNEAHRPAQSVFDVDSRTANWRLLTVRNVRASYGNWLGWLARQDLLSSVQSPAQRVTEERLRAYLAELQGRFAPWTVRTRIHHLELALSAMEPDASIVVLKRVCRRLGRPQAKRDKSGTIKSSEALFELGVELMREAEQGHFLPRRTPADHFRDGLQIALMSSRPLRNGNFSKIQIGQHLITVGGQYLIAFSADEVKNGRPIQFAFPESLHSALERYLSHYRPMLLRDVRDETALWVSGKGTPQRPCTTAKWIQFWTKTKFGKPINPHLFRDCAATSIAIHRPTEVGIVHALLGNSYATSERYYNQASSIEAGRELEKVLQKMRSAIR